ncbi:MULTISPECIES: SDR family oxidoreductase [unclassified Streptomyces]|uniref:SDR family oxidoreductase n=1 Tax=unclassified Streptomyces TaxID=2593676 RepID=UPI002E1110AB|nr:MULTISPECIES: SDR family oxidoreductase [unclassified Streptomyces]WSJ34769.1 SDR family oxidoreductase [Streptomyces sp. NBC_01321]WSP61211.1 SDR family oxidoreductase [Streptomyces sp. NBC_01240]
MNHSALDTEVHGEDLLFALSARSADALRAGAGRLADWLTDGGAQTPLTDVAHTLALRRAHLRERLVLRAPDRTTLVGLLRAVADGAETGPRAQRGRAAEGAASAPVFVFSGHGSQWDGMGRQLLAGNQEFAALVDRIEPVVRAESGISLRSLLAAPGLVGSGMDHVQPAVYAMQVGLAEMWRGACVEPAAVIGHSMGEVAAAVVAGALSAEDGARVICRRSRLMERRLAGTGATALVELDAATARARLAGRTGISVAVHSSPRACVVAGRPDAVAEFVTECQSEELLARLVPGVRIGAHSPLVDPLLADLHEGLADLVAGELRLPYYSATSEDPRQRPALDAAYWAQNLRRPVRLTEAVRAAADDGLRVFLEVSPHPVVAQSVLETLLDAGGGRPDGSTVIGTLQRGAQLSTAFGEALAALHCAGFPLPRQTVPTGRLADLPSYAWQRQDFPPRRRTLPAPAEHPLLGRHIVLPGVPVRHVWQSRISRDTVPWAADHQVHGAPVLPGTGYAELVLAAACEAFGAAPGQVAVSDLEFRRVLPLAPVATVTTAFDEDPDADAGTVTVSAGAASSAHVVATARVRHATAPVPAPGAPAPGEGERREPADVYAALRALGQEHGPAFAAVTEVEVADGTVVCRVERPAGLPRDRRFVFHPALLDACLHGLGALLPPDIEGTHLPTGVGELRVTGTPGDTLVSRARLSPGPVHGGLLADVRVYAEDGTEVASLTGVRLSPVGEDTLPVDVAPLLHEVRWDQLPAPHAPFGDGCSVLVLHPDAPADGDPRLTALVAALTAAGARCTVRPDSGPPPPAGTADLVVLSAWPARGDAEPVPDAGRRAVAALLRTAAALLRTHEESGTAPPALTVVTAGAQAVLAGDRPDPAQTALRGAVRSLHQERPELRPRTVDVDEATDPHRTAAEILATDGPDEVAWRAGQRYAARLVVAPDAPDARPHIAVRPGGGYLVSGGTRGLGLATARWLAERGAGAVVLGGRGPLGDKAQRELAALRAMGTRVELVNGDVAQPGTAARLVAAVEATGARLRGVVHAAAVLDDALVTEEDAERLDGVWAPKAMGAWRLHEATVATDLDWWVGYSSLASLVGSAGQSAYAAANAFLDGVVSLRRASGQRALAVNWGPWSDIGAVRGKAVEGVGALTAREGFAALEVLLTRDAPRTGVVRLSGAEFARVHPQARTSSFFGELFAGAEGGPDAFDRAALDALEPRQRAAAVRARTLLGVARVLGFTEAEHVAGRPLVHLGLDSLTAVRIKNTLRADFAVDIPVTRLLQGASAEELAEQVAAALWPRAAGAGPRLVVADGVRDAALRTDGRAARLHAARARRGKGRQRGTDQ